MAINKLPTATENLVAQQIGGWRVRVTYDANGEASYPPGLASKYTSKVIHDPKQGNQMCILKHVPQSEIVPEATWDPTYEEDVKPPEIVLKPAPPNDQNKFDSAIKQLDTAVNAAIVAHVATHGNGDPVVQNYWKLWEIWRRFLVGA